MKATKHREILRKKAKHFEDEAQATNDKFNKGYFEGKAEAFRLAHDCLGFDKDHEINDVLNGDL